MVVREGEDLLDNVDCQAKDDLFCAPGGVALTELFERDGLLPCNVVFVIRVKEFVDGTEEMPHHLSSLFWPPLGYTDKIIEVYFDVG